MTKMIMLIIFVVDFYHLFGATASSPHHPPASASRPPSSPLPTTQSRRPAQNLDRARVINLPNRHRGILPNDGQKPGSGSSFVQAWAV
jgi:hypothetical protein